jgi:lysozyme
VAKKKNKTPAGILLFIALMLCFTAAILYYSNRPKFVRYPAFGIDIPTIYSIHGIDVSHYQSSIDWDEVKAMQVKNIKIGFAFIKATEGIEDVDNAFKTNWKGAKKASIPRGAYHFFNPYRSGKAQAENFIDAVKLAPGDLPPVLDVEQAGTLGKEKLQQRVSEWLTIVERHYKVKPVIYTGADFYSNLLKGKFDDYPLWVAHYLVKDKPRVSRDWSFWQHNEAGHVNGVYGFVDFNGFNGDSAAFNELLIKD